MNLGARLLISTAAGVSVLVGTTAAIAQQRTCADYARRLCPGVALGSPELQACLESKSDQLPLRCREKFGLSSGVVCSTDADQDGFGASANSDSDYRVYSIKAPRCRDPLEVAGSS